MNFLILIVAAYLLGSVPFAFIIAKSMGKDLRKVGSGNIGATNLARSGGRKWGYICFGLDLAKGLVPVVVAVSLMDAQPGAGELSLALAVGAAAILGHVFPVYIGFKGGKGVATGFGVAVGFWPYLTIPALIAIGVWVAVVAMWRYISLGSIAAAAVFPLALVTAIIVVQNWQLRTLWPLVLASSAISAMVIVLHRTNIARLAAGTESRVFENRSV